MTDKEQELRDYFYNALNYRVKYDTGYERGRPCIGEIREPSENAIKMQAWRKKNAEYFRACNRVHQRNWVTKNRERNKENNRNRLMAKKQTLNPLDLSTGPRIGIFA
jgi:hypothetical protein